MDRHAVTGFVAHKAGAAMQRLKLRRDLLK
jgi:hypothetical protein